MIAYAFTQQPLLYWLNILKVNVPSPTEAGASCFSENSTTDSEELWRLTLSPQAQVSVRPTVLYALH